LGNRLALKDDDAAMHDAEPCPVVTLDARTKEADSGIFLAHGGDRELQILTDLVLAKEAAVSQRLQDVPRTVASNADCAATI
jgi:hypothetical protein